MSNEMKEEIIILLNETRNKVNKAIIMYQQNNEDPVYLQTIRTLIDDEIHDLIMGKDYDL